MAVNAADQVEMYTGSCSSNVFVFISDDFAVTVDGSDSYQAVKDAGRFRFVLWK